MVLNALAGEWRGLSGNEEREFLTNPDLLVIDCFGRCHALDIF
jgi:hypothetical protein